jgi:hypothetical protein
MLQTILERRGLIKMTWNESEIIQTYVRQYDIIVDLLHDEGLSTFQQTITVMDKILDSFGSKQEGVN